MAELSDPALYINRELSQLEFVRRVLAQAEDRAHPLLERFRFLCIGSAVLDEFFEIRVAGLLQQQAHGSAQRGPDGLSPGQQLQRISETTHALVNYQSELLHGQMLPKLDQQGIRLLAPQAWNARQRRWLATYFERAVAPHMEPRYWHPDQPFPQPGNKNLSYLVIFDAADTASKDRPMAVMNAPRELSRVIALGGVAAPGVQDFVLLDALIGQHAGQLFPERRVAQCYAFRVTRNSDLFIDEEAVDDLLQALQGELPSRNFGAAVRLEVAQACPDEWVALLAQQFALTSDQIYRGPGPLNLTRLAVLPDMVARPDLKYAQMTPSVPAVLRDRTDCFDVIRHGDLLLHHPFQSFLPVLEFLQTAAQDPDVLSIHQTLYRTGTDSAVVDALAGAAACGKAVTVLIELRARFEEAANIALANKLQKAGVNVVYGTIRRKTHAKMCLVERREAQQVRGYVHLGTGNYHAVTARAYTDYGLLTCDPALVEDVRQLFQELGGASSQSTLRRILRAPQSLHNSMLTLIRNEAENARCQRPAAICAKMNSLAEPRIIEALYAASAAGVQIDLIVRGICMLRPGLPGVSDNIRVRSVVGRFLEHTRVFYFANDGDPKLFLSSADWMSRNFFSRVETCFPVPTPQLRERIFHEAITQYLQDTANAWELQADGTYQWVGARPRRVAAQETLLSELAE